MIPPSEDPLNFLNTSQDSELNKNSQTDLIQDLLYEIIRVKELVKYYESVPNRAGEFGASILAELVSEAYKSLVDYDVTLMKKYYELLQSCD